MVVTVGPPAIREARRRLGQQLAALRKAAGHTQHSLAPLTYTGAVRSRSSVLNQIGLCSALFLAGEPDPALTVGATVLDQANQLASARVIDRIHNLRRDLTHHTHQPAVQQFSRTLATVAA